MTFIDTNVLIDIISGDSRWSEWSSAQLELATSTSGAAINLIVFAELSRNFATPDELRRLLAALGVSTVELEAGAAFLAGKAFAEYRKTRRDDRSPRVLPDFLIGAHASTLGLPLLTRDPTLYRRYFPDLTLITPPPITPETDHG